MTTPPTQEARMGVLEADKREPFIPTADLPDDALVDVGGGVIMTLAEAKAHHNQKQFAESAKNPVLEAMARAMYCASDGVDPGSTAHLDYWFKHPDPGDEGMVDDYRIMARAALQALLDNVTPEMWDLAVNGGKACFFKAILAETGSAERSWKSAPPNP